MDLNTNDTPKPWPVLASHCPPGLLVGFAAVAPNAAPCVHPVAVSIDFSPAPQRGTLQQYDREQQPGYRDGYEDGRLKGYEVGHRHATERAANAEQDTLAKERERCAAIVRKLRRSLAGTTAKQLASEAALQIERGA